MRESQHMEYLAGVYERRERRTETVAGQEDATAADRFVDPAIEVPEHFVDRIGKAGVDEPPVRFSLREREVRIGDDVVDLRSAPRSAARSKASNSQLAARAPPIVASLRTPCPSQ